MSDGKLGLLRLLVLFGLCAVSACDEPQNTSPGETPPDAAQFSATADLPTLLQQARATLGAGRAVEAAQVARQGLSIDSTHAELNNLLATAMAIQGQSAEAIETVQRALRHHPDYALAHLNLGGIYFRLQQFDEAETHLLRAAELDPIQPSTHRRLSDLYRTMRRPDQAVTSIQKAADLLPREATFAYLMGLSHEQGGAVAQAIDAYTEAARLDPSLVEAWKRILEMREHVDAESVAAAESHLKRLQALAPQASQQFGQLRQAVLSSPEDPANHYRLGAFLLEQSLWDLALNKLRRATALQPGDARLLNHVGGLLTRAQRLEDALPFYLQAADADPNDATALLNAGSLFAMQGKVEQALPLYERALARDPDNPQVHYYYGLTLNSAGKRDEGLRVLQTGLELAGDSEFAQQIRQSLEAISEVE